jgi:hypothetical protein
MVQQLWYTPVIAIIQFTINKHCNMSNRLDQDREAELQPKRMETGKTAIERLGYTVKEVGGATLVFEYMGYEVRYYPYSGWHTGKTIRDGRGLDKLLKQIK